MCNLFPWDVSQLLVLWSRMDKRSQGQTVGKHCTHCSTTESFPCLSLFIPIWHFAWLLFPLYPGLWLCLCPQILSQSSYSIWSPFLSHYSIVSLAAISVTLSSIFTFIPIFLFFFPQHPSFCLLHSKMLTRLHLAASLFVQDHGLS